MSTSLYQISPETKTRINKFRTATSRAEKLEHLVIKIQPKPSYEVVVDDQEDGEDNDDDDDDWGVEVNDLKDLPEALPDNLPRFVLLAYPLVTKDGLKKTPLVLLYWKPPTVVSQEWKMVYAGCLEMVRSFTNPNKFLEVNNGLEDEDDVQDLKEQIEA